MHRYIVIGVLVAGLSLFGSARADICDDINDLSNGWNELANFMHEHEEDGFDDNEADQLDDLMRQLVQPTRAIGEALVNVGNEEEEELGQELLYYVNELQSRERGDLVAYLVDVIDDIVDSVDAVVDYCDSVGSRSR